MSKDQQKTLLLLAEEAIYSSKGHFKTADWMKIALTCYVIIPLLTSLLMLIFNFSGSWQRILLFLGFFFSCLALNSTLNNNKDKADKIIEQHFELGNKYLEIFKQARNLNCDIQNLTIQKLNEIQNEVTQLDAQSTQLPISFIGRWWAKLRIKEEVDLKWVYQKEN